MGGGDDKLHPAVNAFILVTSESQKAISVTSPDSQIDMMWFSRILWQLNPHFVPFRHCGTQNSHICLPDYFPKLQLKHTNCGILDRLQVI